MNQDQEEISSEAKEAAIRAFFGDALIAEMDAAGDAISDALTDLMMKAFEAGEAKGRAEALRQQVEVSPP